MAQYGSLLREQAQFLEGSSRLNYSIYLSPDRYKQNPIGMNSHIKNNPNYYGRSQSFIDEQNYLLKTAGVKDLQGNNMNLLNTVNYNNQELWDELNINATDPAYVQNVLGPTYLPQESLSIAPPQKSIMTYGNVTPISPNHNKLLSGYVDGISGNKIIDGALISDINSPALKENIDVIQQQTDLIDNNVLPFSIPDLKAINSGKFNLIGNTNNEEIMAANTLLGPKSNVNSEPLLTDVVLMPTNSYSNISQESVLPTAVPTPLNTSVLPTTTTFAHNYQKVNKDFYSPVLSPSISQIYSNKALNVQANPLSINPKAVEYERINKLRKNTVPLIKTTINKKTNKLSKSFSAVNLKAINPVSIKTGIMNKNKMDIDVNTLKEKEAVKLNSSGIVPQELNIEKAVASESSNLLLNKTALVAEPFEINPVVMTPNSSVSSSSSSSVDDDKITSVEVNTKKEEKKDDVKEEKMEIDKPIVTLKKEEKQVSKKESIVEKKEVKSTLEDKKETIIDKTIRNNKLEETKKEEKKTKEVTLPEKVTKEKTEDKKEKSKTTSSAIKEIENTKKDSKKETTSDDTKPKKRPRFSAKNCKNDPAALEAHVLLKRKRNTEAARRSRQRKVQQMKNLEEAVQRLTKELEQTNNELKDVKEKYEKVVEESKISKETYETKIKILEEQLKQYNP